MQTLKRVQVVIGLFTVLGLSGCGSLPETTLGHTCGIPDGVGCMSTQEVYQRTVNGDLPGLNVGGERQPSSSPTDRSVDAPFIVDDSPKIIRTSALYAPPEELRIWVNRWRDRDGDLHDDSFMYVLVGEGEWLVRD